MVIIQNPQDEILSGYFSLSDPGNVQVRISFSAYKSRLRDSEERVISSLFPSYAEMEIKPRTLNLIKREVNCTYTCSMYVFTFGTNKNFLFSSACAHKTELSIIETPAIID